MTTALYPGTFDPITNGHLNIIGRALTQYDGLLIAVSDHEKKNPLFSVEERIDMVRAATKEFGDKVKVIPFSNLAADCARENKVKAIVRGLRVTSDFEYEFTMARYIRQQAPEVETVFLMADAATLHISSSSVKEIAKLGGDVSDYVPTYVVQNLEKKYAA